MSCDDPVSAYARKTMSYPSLASFASEAALFSATLAVSVFFPALAHSARFLRVGSGYARLVLVLPPPPPPPGPSRVLLKPGTEKLEMRNKKCGNEEMARYQRRFYRLCSSLLARGSPT